MHSADHNAEARLQQSIMDTRAAPDPVCERLITLIMGVGMERRDVATDIAIAITANGSAREPKVRNFAAAYAIVRAALHSGLTPSGYWRHRIPLRSQLWWRVNVRLAQQAVAAKPTRQKETDMDGQIISDCQRILAEHLPPDGPDAKTTISRLLEILDGPRSRAVEPTGPAVTVGRVEDWRVFAALANGERMPVFGIFKSTEPGKMTETHDLTEATHIVVAGGIVSLDSGAQVVVEAVY